MLGRLGSVLTVSCCECCTTVDVRSELRVANRSVSSPRRYLQCSLSLVATDKLCFKLRLRRRQALPYYLKSVHFLHSIAWMMSWLKKDDHQLKCCENIIYLEVTYAIHVSKYELHAIQDVWCSPSMCYSMYLTFTFSVLYNLNSYFGLNISCPQPSLFVPWRTLVLRTRMT